MSRTLILLFRRDPSCDRQTNNIHFTGYKPLWPDGRPVAVGLDAFCKIGQRLLGLNKHLAGCEEKLVKMVCIPLDGQDDELNRIPGYRVRRFFLKRTGTVGKIHFMDGTPTVADVDLTCDDPRVINWIGLNTIDDGEILWFDLAAVGMETAITHTTHSSRSRLQAVEA